MSANVSIASSRGMAGVIKSFSQEDWERTDVKGRLAVNKWLDRRFAAIGKDWLTFDNTDPYGIDLLTFNKKDEVTAAWEVEVREGNWKGDIDFPFSTINCIERKEYQWRKDAEFLSKIDAVLAKRYDVYYVQTNDICTKAVILHGDVILQEPLVRWSNRKASGEYVRQVPVNKAIQVSLV